MSNAPKKVGSLVYVILISFCTAKGDLNGSPLVFLSVGISLAGLSVLNCSLSHVASFSNFVYRQTPRVRQGGEAGRERSWVKDRLFRRKWIIRVSLNLYRQNHPEDLRQNHHPGYQIQNLFLPVVQR